MLLCLFFYHSADLSRQLRLRTARLGLPEHLRQPGVREPVRRADDGRLQVRGRPAPRRSRLRAAVRVRLHLPGPLLLGESECGCTYRGRYFSVSFVIHVELLRVLLAAYRTSCAFTHCAHSQC